MDKMIGPQPPDRESIKTTAPNLISQTFLLPTLLLFLFLPLLTYLLPRIHRDYQAFLALGPGGTPSTFSGYIRVSILQLFSLQNPLHPPTTPPTLDPQSGILTRTRTTKPTSNGGRALPRRPGPRPKLAGLAPQRQTTQKSSKEMFTTLSAEITSLSQRHPERLRLGTSCFEKHSIGLFSVPQVLNRVTCNGEVCHAHPSDGSLHLTLHPDDVREVIEKGWGERHPLARDNWWWRVKIVPSGFVLIYAPRDEGELGVVMEIIRAAAWWVGGSEL